MDFCSKNASLHKRQHQFRIGFYNVFCLSDAFLGFAVHMHFRPKKPTKNPSKTKSDTFKNRCWKHFVFQHRFFHVLGSILESLRLPRLNQVGHFWPPKTRDGAPFEPSWIKCLLKMASWRPQDSNLEPLGSILGGFGLDFGAFGMLQGRFLKVLDLLLIVVCKTCASHI